MEREIKRSVVSKEKAEEEVQSWLDFKKVSDSDREEHADYIKALANYISCGDLVLNEDKSFTHKLKFPIGVGEAITHLTYKSRMNSQQLKPYLSGVKTGDSNGLINAHICALSGENAGVIGALDKEDIKIARAIVVFFV